MFNNLLFSTNDTTGNAILTTGMCFGQILPSGGAVISYTDGGVLIGGIPTIYSGQNVKPNVIEWVDKVFTNSSGQAIFRPTSDRTASGTAIFTNIYGMSFTAMSGTNTITSMPFCSIKSVNFGNKEVVVNTLVANAIGILGALGLDVVGGGVPVFAKIIGD
jgi:hypothetical protein